MKCPKCGYLGFETTDRCRNCQYDFSLAPFASEPELTLQGADRRTESGNDFELPAIKRQSDRLSASVLDLDRLFGDPEPSASAPPDSNELPRERKLEAPSITVLDADAPDAIEEPIDDAGLAIPAEDEPAAITMPARSRRNDGGIG